MDACFEVVAADVGSAGIPAGGGKLSCPAAVSRAASMLGLLLASYLGMNGFTMTGCLHGMQASNDKMDDSTAKLEAETTTHAEAYIRRASAEAAHKALHNGTAAGQLVSLEQERMKQQEQLEGVQKVGAPVIFFSSIFVNLQGSCCIGAVQAYARVEGDSNVVFSQTPTAMSNRNFMIRPKYLRSMHKWSRQQEQQLLQL